MTDIYPKPPSILQSINQFDEWARNVILRKDDYAKYVPQPIFNVKGYGAIGDGVTDDTAAIQAAIDAAGDGGRIFIPYTPTGYKLSPDANGVCLYIPYNEVVLFSNPKTEYGVKLFCTTPNATILKVSGYGFHMHSIQLKGDGVIPTELGTVNGILFDRAGDPNIDAEITFCGFFLLNKCIEVYGRNLFVHYNIFSCSARGIVIHDSVSASNEIRGHRITNNRFHSMGFGGGAVVGVGFDTYCIEADDVTFGIQVIGNFADFCRGFYKGPAKRSSFSGNIYYHGNGPACFEITATSTTPDYVSMITDNLISGLANYDNVPDTEVDLLKYGIYGNINVHYLHIANNVINTTRYEAIKFNSFYHSAIQANTIVNPCFRADYDDQLYNAITLGAIIESIIVNNQVRHTKPNNVVPYNYAIGINGQVSGSLVAHNRINNGASGRINVSTVGGTDNRSIIIDMETNGLMSLFLPYCASTSMGYSFRRCNLDGIPIDIAKMLVTQLSGTVGAEKGSITFNCMNNGVDTPILTLNKLNNKCVTIEGSAWDGVHLVMGNYHLWVDSSDRLRIKDGAPTSDTDGVIVGTQS